MSNTRAAAASPSRTRSWATVGQDLVFLPFLSNLYSLWQLPVFAERTAAARRVVHA